MKKCVSIERMRFPKQLYSFELAKGDLIFQFENHIEFFEVGFKGTKVNISVDNCAIFFESLRKLGFELDGR